MDFMTASNKNAEALVIAHKPDFIVGLKVNPEVLPKNTYVIDNTKSASYLYEDYPKFICGENISRSHLLYSFLKVDNHAYPMVQIADMFSVGRVSDDQELFYYLYKALGASTFVHRFAGNMDMKLTKYEQQLALYYRKNMNTIADELLEFASDKKDGLVVCKSGFDMRDVIEGTIISKYQDDLSVIATWDFGNDGNVYINISSQSDLAGKMSEKLGGENYYRNGMATIKIPEDSYEGITDYITDLLYETMEDVKAEHWREICNEKEKELAEQYGTDMDRVEHALSDGF